MQKKIGDSISPANKVISPLCGLSQGNRGRWGFPGPWKGTLEAASTYGPSENPERWPLSYPCPGQSPLCRADALANEPKLA